jgi:hypothetical protein
MKILFLLLPAVLMAQENRIAKSTDARRIQMQIPLFFEVDCRPVGGAYSGGVHRLLMHRRVQSLSPCDASEGERQRNKIVVRNRGNDDIELI